MKKKKERKKKCVHIGALISELIERHEDEGTCGWVEQKRRSLMYANTLSVFTSRFRRRYWWAVNLNDFLMKKRRVICFNEFSQRWIHLVIAVFFFFKCGNIQKRNRKWTHKSIVFNRWAEKKSSSDWPSQNWRLTGRCIQMALICGAPFFFKKIKKWSNSAATAPENLPVEIIVGFSQENYSSPADALQ